MISQAPVSSKPVSIITETVVKNVFYFANEFRTVFVLEESRQVDVPDEPRTVFVGKYNMAGLQFPTAKDESSDLDYIMDWSDWLGTDKISSSVWVVPGPLDTTGNAFNDTVATIWLNNGVGDTTYTLTNTITTLGGRTTQRDVKLKVKNR